MNPKPRAYFFVGGGTGGHLYPAIAIAEQITLLDPDAKISFVCSDRPIDSRILSDAGVEFTTVSATPLARSIPGLRAFVRGWRESSQQMRELIVDQLPTRDVVLVAMGGFVAPAPARAARRIRVPIVLVNLDAIPGKANLLIARFADLVCSALPVRSKPWRVLGPVVRASASAGNPDPHARFGLDAGRRTLLVTGGSQGAQSINEFMCAMLGHHPGAFAGWQIIHQTGNESAALEDVYGRARIPAWVGSYIEHMGDAWACADLTIGRCGAGTVAESWASGVPGVFLPYPFHRDQHQKHNAQVLVDAGAALVFDDHIDAQTNINAHGTQLAGILSDPSRLAQLASGFDALGRSDGARAAAELLVGFRA